MYNIVYIRIIILIKIVNYKKYIKNKVRRGLMNNILEIKSVCNTPEELLRSEDFSRFLKIFKSAHIKLSLIHI